MVKGPMGKHLFIRSTLRIESGMEPFQTGFSGKLGNLVQKRSTKLWIVGPAAHLVQSGLAPPHVASQVRDVSPIMQFVKERIVICIKNTSPGTAHVGTSDLRLYQRYSVENMYIYLRNMTLSCALFRHNEKWPISSLLGVSCCVTGFSNISSEDEADERTLYVN